MEMLLIFVSTSRPAVVHASHSVPPTNTTTALVKYAVVVHTNYTTVNARIKTYQKIHRTTPSPSSSQLALSSLQSVISISVTHHIIISITVTHHIIIIISWQM